MKKEKIILFISLSVLLLFIIFITKQKEIVNFCGHTIEEANNPIHWHKGIYSPTGCDLTKYQITK